MSTTLEQPSRWYEHTISEAFEPGRLTAFLNSLKNDNTVAVKRAGYNEIIEFVIPAVRKAFRMAKNIPVELMVIDKIYLARVMWQKSNYVYAIMQNKVLAFKEVGVGVEPDYSVLDGFNHFFAPSSSHRFNKDSIRNKRSLKKANGLPTFGKKGDNFDGTVQYVTQVIKTDPRMGNFYSVLEGYRTQQSSEEEPKVRLVWSVPGTQWYMEGEAFDSAIDQAIQKCQQANLGIQGFYFDPREDLKQWVNHYKDQVVEWVNLDAEQYDSTVQLSELISVVDWLAGGYEFKKVLSYAIAASDIVTPDGIVSRLGGMPSGSKVTNLGDGLTNVLDILSVLKRLKLLRYVVCVLVNGDDITIGFSTRITRENLIKIGKYSRRNINADKSMVLSTGVWNSKWFCDGVINTRPIFRAINSLLYKERQANALTINAVYVAIARHQILLDVEEHPLYSVLARELAKREEYTLWDAIDDPRWNDTLKQYIADHDYNGTMNKIDFVEKMKKSRYASEFAVGTRNQAARVVA